MPRDRMTVVTGVSGSGKSTLAFDIVFAEGQRRYLESLNAYARQFVQPAARPDVDAIFGIPPTVAIEQRTSRGGRKSTVATLTEIHHFLRLLYVKLGTQYCPDCDVPIEPQSADAIAARLLRDCRGRRSTLLAPLSSRARATTRTWPSGRLGRATRTCASMASCMPTERWPRLDRFKEHTIELPTGDVEVSPRRRARAARRAAPRARLRQGRRRTCIDRGAGRSVFSTRARVRRAAAASPSPTRGSSRSTRSTAGARRASAPALQHRGFDEEQSRRGNLVERVVRRRGRLRARLRRAAAQPGRAATCASASSPSRSSPRCRSTTRCEFFARAEAARPRSRDRARPAAPRSARGSRSCDDVGLGYLSLDRSAPTLSGGEAQRIRLAAQLGSNLQGVCYVLDEPTIGLHPRDNAMLLDTLDAARARRATRCWSSSTTRTRSGAPIT